jgi:hypothetical protein
MDTSGYHRKIFSFINANRREGSDESVGVSNSAGCQGTVVIGEAIDDQQSTIWRLHLVKKGPESLSDSMSTTCACHEGKVRTPRLASSTETRKKKICRPKFPPQDWSYNRGKISLCISNASTRIDIVTRTNVHAAQK